MDAKPGRSTVRGKQYCFQFECTVHFVPSLVIKIPYGPIKIIFPLLGFHSCQLSPGQTEFWLVIRADDLSELVEAG